MDTNLVYREYGIVMYLVQESLKLQIKQRIQTVMKGKLYL